MALKKVEETNWPSYVGFENEGGVQRIGKRKEKTDQKTGLHAGGGAEQDGDRSDTRDWPPFGRAVGLR